ncbi:hypothetical protein [uncultured Tenacibaculum sp.]|nr:hypothetical protein [uncultured Tenacibaculum sp.]
MKELTTVLKALIGFITNEYDRELKPNYMRVEKEDRRNRFYN